MNGRQLSTIGELADKADNYLGVAALPMPDSVKVDGLNQGLTELSEELKSLYIELSGENPWQD